MISVVSDEHSDVESNIANFIWNIHLHEEVKGHSEHLKYWAMPNLTAAALQPHVSIGLDWARWTVRSKSLKQFSQAITEAILWQTL